MKKTGLILMFTLAVAVMVPFTGADSDTDRVMRTYKMFSTSVDKLLLETKHVWIQPKHETDGFYLPNFGPVFTADISITAGASVPKMVEQWTSWFDSSDGKFIINTKKKTEQKDSEELKRKQAEKEKKYKQEDLERLQNMNHALDSFKEEVMEVLLDFGPTIQGTDKDDKIAIVFHVADEHYCETFGTKTFQVQVKVEDLKTHMGSSPKDSAVAEVFIWNI